MSGTVTASSFGSEEQITEDLFTPEYKRLKARNPAPDLSTVVDLDHYTSTGETVISRNPIRCCDLKPVAGLRPCQEWKVFQFRNYPGLIVIKNPFIDGYQRYWVHRCLESFPSDKDNVTNLTALGDNSSQDLWQQFVHKKCETFDKHDPLRKLRWTTLGYHYNWTTKEYSEDNKATFPLDVSCLSQYFAACLGFTHYRAEAAIVNYYHLDSTLAGHTDHSEVDHSAPLFSISFGQTAIFLLGGSSKSVKPMSVFLRSGDVCVMSGECRLAYHAVPKILAPTSEEPLLSAFSLRHIDKHGLYDSITSTSSNCGLHGERKNVNSENSFKAVASNADKPAGISDSCSTDCVRSTQSHIGQSHIGHLENAEIAHRATEDEANPMNNNGNQKCKEDAGCFNDYRDNIEKVNSEIEEVVAALDFHPFHVYLKSSRINLNIRQVLPPGVTRLQDKSRLQSLNNSCDFSSESLCARLIKRNIQRVSECKMPESGTDVSEGDRCVSDVVQESEETADVYSGIDDTKKIKMNDSAS
ncbi:unnamed protein product [Candidula unifasciata]|uniref:Fe2OG dioxygenase domain-containing protein n=1 Tax=Candidula unifasciata TaxID=100452 RepID=A0A8S3ZXD6_9EUPU|nr:unnamed protein product [Candidula unifasciata]